MYQRSNRKYNHFLKISLGSITLDGMPIEDKTCDGVILPTRLSITEGAYDILSEKAARAHGEESPHIAGLVVSGKLEVKVREPQ